MGAASRKRWYCVAAASRVRTLEDGSLQKLALLKLQGYSNGEIAAQFGLTERSVERKLGRIRKIWGDSSPGLAPSAK